MLLTQLQESLYPIPPIEFPSPVIDPKLHLKHILGACNSPRSRASMMMPELDAQRHARGVDAEKRRTCFVKELAANEYAHTAPLTTPVEECFNWAQELPDLVATSHGAAEFYVVMFRSIRKSSADTVQLYSADAAAHDEARLSGGLLKYWYGTLNERRECLAMCIWASRDDAVKAIHKRAHREAQKLAPVMYDAYTLEKYSLKIDANLRPSFTLLGSMSS